jgi:hypothetical protein
MSEDNSANLTSICLPDFAKLPMSVSTRGADSIILTAEFTASVPAVLCMAICP